MFGSGAPLLSCKGESLDVLGEAEVVAAVVVIGEAEGFNCNIS